MASYEVIISPKAMQQLNEYVDYIQKSIFQGRIPYFIYIERFSVKNTGRSFFDQFLRRRTTICMKKNRKI